MGYVIYLKSSTYGNTDNSYGYWTGKKYIVQEEAYPICDKEITENTKVYKNRKIAENSAEKAVERFGYVTNYKIEEVKKD